MADVVGRLQVARGTPLHGTITVADHHACTSALPPRALERTPMPERLPPPPRRTSCTTQLQRVEEEDLPSGDSEGRPTQGGVECGRG